MKKIVLSAFVLILSYPALLSAQDLAALKSVRLMDALSNDSISLVDYSKASLMVIIFTSNYCPYSRIYESRIKEIHQNYEQKGVQLYLVNPNKGEDDGLREMRQKANQQQYRFPYLSDKDRVLTELLGATRTPEAFLIRKRDYRLLYHGALDDNPQAPDYVESEYLIDSIEKAIAGNPVSPDYMKVIGCMIKETD